MMRFIEFINKKVIGMFLLICLLYLFAMYFGFKLSLWVMAKFICLNLVGIFLPGIALAIILKVKLPRLSYILYSYILGTIIVVCEYFFSEIFDRAIPFTMVTAIIAAFSIIIIASNRFELQAIFNSVNDDDWICLLFFAIFLTFSVLTYSANSLGPSACGMFTTSRDMQFWCSNTVALKIDFPGDKLFMHGNELKYHYFSGIPIAFLSDVFGIDVFTLSFPLYSLTKPFFMIGSVFFLLDQFKVKKFAKAFIGTAVLFSTGLEAKSIVTFVHHSMISPFGCDIGLALGMIFIALLVKQWQDVEFDVKNYVQCIFVWAFCVGAKAPVASVLLLFPALLCFFWLIRKNWKNAIIYGMTILAVFVLINKCCVMENSNYDWGSRLSFYSVQEIVADVNNAVVSEIFTYSKILALVVAAIVKCFYLQPMWFLFAILWLIYNIKLITKKQFEIEKLYLESALLLTSLWGLILWLFVNAGGRSEMYFAMAALLALIPIICLYSDERSLIKNKMTVMSVKVIMILALVICTYNYLMNGYGGVGVLKESFGGLKKLINATYKDELVSKNYADSITESDIEALNWLRENTDRKSLVLSDKAIILENPRYYMYGIFSERQQYLEGTSTLGAMRGRVHDEIERRQVLTKYFYDNEYDAYLQMKSEGIDYIIQTKNVTPEFEAKIDRYELMYESSSIRIYKMR